MVLQPKGAARKAAVNCSVRNGASVPAAMLGRSTLAYLTRVIERRYGVSPQLAATIAEIIGAGVRP